MRLFNRLFLFMIIGFSTYIFAAPTWKVIDFSANSGGGGNTSISMTAVNAQNCVTITSSYKNVPAAKSSSIYPGITEITISYQMVGGAGGAGGTSLSSPGLDAQTVYGTFTYTPGIDITLYVGSGGEASSSGYSGRGGRGYKSGSGGGIRYNFSNQHGGGGGGSSGIVHNGQVIVANGGQGGYASRGGNPGTTSHGPKPSTGGYNGMEGTNSGGGACRATNASGCNVSPGTDYGRTGVNGATPFGSWNSIDLPPDAGKGRASDGYPGIIILSYAAPYCII